MFKSDKPYTSLDGFFHTDRRHGIRSAAEIEKRIRELDSLFSGWKDGPYRFPGNDRENGEWNHYCDTTIETLREASQCYVMGFFSATILLSSVAAERLLRCVLLVKGAVRRLPVKIASSTEETEEFRKTVPDASGRRKIAVPNKVENEGRRYAAIKVETVYGPEYYVVRRGLERIVEVDKNTYRLDLHMSGAKLLRKAQEQGCRIDALLAGELLDKCAFVARRNAAAHGSYELTGDLLEQEYVGRSLIGGEAAFDQYKRAAGFAKETLAWLDAQYGHR